MNRLNVSHKCGGQTGRSPLKEISCFNIVRRTLKSEHLAEKIKLDKLFETSYSSSSEIN